MKTICLFGISAHRVLVPHLLRCIRNTSEWRRKCQSSPHIGWCLCWLYLCGRKMSFFSCSVAFPAHLGWYLMGLVISPEMHKGECISHNLSLWCSLCWYKIQICFKEDHLARSTDHNALIRLPEALKWTLLLVIWCNCFILKSEAKRVCLRLMRHFLIK